MSTRNFFLPQLVMIPHDQNTLAMGSVDEEAIASQKHHVHDFRKRFLSMPFLPLTKLKKLFSSDRGFKGPVWLSYSQMDSPLETDLRDLLWKAVCDLNTEKGAIQKPEYATSGTVWGEWMGYRKDGVVAKHGPSQTQSQKDAEDAYRALSREVESSTTTLFFHGGTYVFGNPSTSRGVLSQICKATKGRSFSATYRLGPEHTFPSYLLDALVTYLSLAYPPPGSLHEAVPFEKLVLAGESAGAAICLAVVKVLLIIREKFLSRGQRPVIQFFGRQVSLELPAGLALHSVPAEWLMVLPSCNTYFFPDYISGGPPYHSPDCPSDKIWPSNPPRAEPHADASALLHPLITLCAISDWRGCPPLMILCGEERLIDSNMIVAQQAARQGVKVELVVYEYMPHIFAMVLAKLPQTAHCIREWSRAINSFTAGAPAASSARRIRLGDLQEEPLDIEKLISLDPQQALDFSRHYLPAKVAFTGTKVTTIRTKTGSTKL